MEDARLCVPRVPTSTPTVALACAPYTSQPLEGRCVAPQDSDGLAAAHTSEKGAVLLELQISEVSH